jgi:hypothetical protein
LEEFNIDEMTIAEIEKEREAIWCFLTRNTEP